MNNEQQMIQYLLHCSNSLERRFVYSKDAEFSESKKANYLTPAQKYKQNALGSFGTVSDAYILYVIAVMEFATEDTILKILQAYSRDNKFLEIPANERIGSGTKGISYRIHRLCSEFAMCFMRQYKIQKEDRVETVTLWGCDQTTTSFVNRRMSKNVSGRDGTIYDNINSMISKAAASYAAAEVADGSGCRFRAMMETGLRTSELGTRLLPPILFLDDRDSEDEYEVLFYPAFLNMVDRYQTKTDYKQYLKRKCDEIRNFLYAVTSPKHRKKKEGFVVVVCESQSDMEAFARLCEQIPYTVDCGNIERIYLTSEGILRSVPSLQDAFLKMDKNQEGEISFIKETPPFIKVR